MDTHDTSYFQTDLTDESSLYAALSDVALFLEDFVDDTTPQLGGTLDANGNDIGATTDEIENVFVGDDNYIYFGNDQDCKLGYNTTMGGGLFDCS